MRQQFEIAETEAAPPPALLKKHPSTKPNSSVLFELVLHPNDTLE
jgi:hypothetical protein